MSFYDLIVIGGGASGFFGAIQTATLNEHLKIKILEKTKKPLSKVRISGGGRCNVTHHCFDPAALVKNYPRGGKALRGPLTKFGPEDVIDWFNARGILLKTEEDGRIFPTTDCSETIIDCFFSEIQKLNIELQLQAEVLSIEKKSSSCGFQVKLSDEILECKYLLIATGNASKPYVWLQHLGHRIIDPVPSLFTFHIEDERIEGLAGVTVPQAQVQLEETSFIESGPLLITHWGMSGPAILKLSAWGARFLHQKNYRSKLKVNWLPEWTKQQILDFFKEMQKKAPSKSIVVDSFATLPKNLWKRLVQAAHVDTRVYAQFSHQEQQRLLKELSESEFLISGKSIYKEEFVTCGGVHLDEVNFQTMESRKCKGLYFCGEVLDIDAVTGGFNFQNAWTTSWIAANAIASQGF